MKTSMFLGLILCAAFCADAQTAEEWFQQKETQKKYLLEQNAALKVYLGYAKKGYALAGKGWRIIQVMKEGDLNGHSEFFGALSGVNPRVKASPFVAGTRALWSNLLDRIKDLRNSVRTTRLLTPSETKFCYDVSEGLLQEGAALLEELGLLTTAGVLELSDDERLLRLRRLYGDVQQLHKATSSLSTEIQLLTAQRLRQQVEIHHLKKASGRK